MIFKKLIRPSGTSKTNDAGGCLDAKAISKIQEARNCTKSCIPILLSSIFDTLEECSDYDSHICALSEILVYAR